LRRVERLLLALLYDESAAALVEYIIVAATLTALMILALKGVGRVSRGGTSSHAASLTNHLRAVP
jgi:Flp pilus assembly pilin Flp